MSRIDTDVAHALREGGVRRTDRVLVAVSGGADSVALLHLLLAVGQPAAAAHVHHGLRPAADLDRDFVAALTRRLGVPFGCRQVDAAARDGRSPEARARALRYAALEAVRAEHGCAWIATAHTLDDQAETVLLRQARGTGLDGLAGIAPLVEEQRLLRPLLGLRRAALRGWLVEKGLDWREDQSNLDLRIPRNRLRAQLLPVLEEIHPGAAERIAALADLAREARERAAPAVEAALSGTRDGDGGLWIDPAGLAPLAPVERARTLRALLVRAGLGERITRLHIGRVSRFLAGARRGAALSLPRGAALVRRGDRFWLGRAPGD